MRIIFYFFARPSLFIRVLNDCLDLYKDALRINLFYKPKLDLKTQNDIKFHFNNNEIFSEWLH